MKTQVLAFIVALSLAGLLGFGGWKLERWINWKFSYGNKVDHRIELLEKRVEALEHQYR